MNAPSVPPPRRHYGKRAHGRDRDLGDQAMRVRAGVMAVGIGIVAGSGWGAAIAIARGWNPLVVVPVTIVLTGVGIYVISVGTTLMGARAAGRVHAPSGDSTPRRAEYSRPQALAAQGKYGEAADAWEAAALESAGDPEPYLRLGRLYRDQLRQPEDALAWFRRARTDTDLTGAQELVVIQEIIDLYTTQLASPRNAIPELVRIVERFPGTPAAEAAQRELSEIRDLLRRERDGLATFTTEYLDRRKRRND